MLSRSLDKLVKDFSKNKQPTTALTLIAIASLARQKKEEFTLKEVFNEIENILSKLKKKPHFIEDIKIIAMAPTLGRLCDMGVLEKVSDNPAIYKPLVDLDTLYRYAGELLLILLERL